MVVDESIKDAAFPRYEMGESGTSLHVVARKVFSSYVVKNKIFF